MEQRRRPGQVTRRGEAAFLLTDIVGQPKEFLEASKKRLSGDPAREAMSDEVKNLRREASDLKEALAETLLENQLLKKSIHGDEPSRIREA